MAKKNRKSKGPGVSTNSIGLTRAAKTNGTLVDRAVQIKLLYNTLRKETPEDIYGVQKAYTDVGDNEVQIAMPTKAQLSSPTNYLGAYGLTTIAKMDQPFQLIPKISPQDVLYNVPEKKQPSVMRQLLRKIVDEV
jgi:hypothetical protein